MDRRQRIDRWKRRAEASFPLVIMWLCTLSGVAIFFVPADSSVHATAVLFFFVTAFIAIRWSKDDQR